MAGFAALAAPADPRKPSGSEAAKGGPAEGIALATQAFGFAFTLAAVTALTTFFVESGVIAGVHPGTAGFLLAVGSATAITVRLVAGVRADRRGHGHLWVVVLMVATSCLGFLLLATMASSVLVLGTLLALGAGWGVNGLFFLSIAQQNPSSPGTATGTIVAGISLGGVCGPPIFGLVAEAMGFRAAWLMAGAWALCGALALTRAQSLVGEHLRVAACPSAFPQEPPRRREG